MDKIHTPMYNRNNKNTNTSAYEEEDGVCYILRTLKHWKI